MIFVGFVAFTGGKYLASQKQEDVKLEA